MLTVVSSGISNLNNFPSEFKTWSFMVQQAAQQLGINTNNRVCKIYLVKKFNVVKKKSFVFYFCLTPQPLPLPLLLCLFIFVKTTNVPFVYYHPEAVYQFPSSACFRDSP
jgi:hypothetical protein